MYKNNKPKLLIFASGSNTGGGSGFANLVKSSRGEDPILNARIVGVVSNHPSGGVYKYAQELNIPFKYFPAPFTEESYKEIVNEFKPDWVALSGWIKLVKGLDPKRTINIHPALISQLGGRFAGTGMWGMNVHNAVKQALDNGEISETGLTMHFVNDKYDDGDIFFEYKIPIDKSMSAEDIAHLVNKYEHIYQPTETNKIINWL